MNATENKRFEEDAQKARQTMRLLVDVLTDAEVLGLAAVGDDCVTNEKLKELRAKARRDFGHLFR